MTPFLYKVAEEIHKAHPKSLENVCIVLPGKRPAIFLRRHFAKIIGKSFWEPRFLSISEFMEELSGNKAQDSLSQLFELYKVYLNKLELFVSPDMSDDNSFDSFIKWAPQALSDFNEIDNYLLDGNIVFTDLKNIKGIDEWSFSLDDWSDEQTEFSNFWGKLGKLYRCYREHCIESEFYYSGLLKYQLTSSLSDFEKNINADKVYFVGLNALSTSEEKIIYSLVENKKADVFWDADSYYMNTPIHEAGLFLRRFKQKYADFSWVENNLNVKGDINIFETASTIAQVKYTGELLSNLNEDQLTQTAVVLANESLLIPLLHSLPENIGKVNVTLGYPLIKTSFYSLVQIVVKILKARRKENFRGIYHLDFIELLSHPFSSALFEDGQSVQDIVETLNSDSFIYINKILFLELIKKHSVLRHYSWIFEEESLSYSGVIKELNVLIDIFRKSFSHDKWLTEILFENNVLLNELADLTKENDFLVSLDSFAHLHRQASARKQVSFVGEPLQGLQIMGVLESRALDFERVIILGANEGNLPKARAFNSYIPYELKRYHQLPTHREQDAIFAYYFYRLLQRSEKVSIFYSTESESLGSSEKSRFITQLEFEIDQEKCGLKNQVVQSEVPAYHEEVLSIKPNEQVHKKLERLLEYGLSPSALNNYLRCPLDFYFKYILGLREPEKVEEKVEVTTFGSVVHQVLEDFYKEQIGNKLTTKVVDDWKKRSDKATRAAFKDLYSSDNISRGSNHIILHVAIRYVHKFLDWEKEQIDEQRKQGESITILALEERLECTLDLKPYGINKKIKLRGSADRVDKIGNDIRIIDYKTGDVKPGDVKILSLENEFDSEKKDKVRQLLFYSYMYFKKHGTRIEIIKPAIISLRNLNSGALYLHVDKKSELKPELISEFEEEMAKTIQSMFEEGANWEHQEDAKYCDYCVE